MARKLHPSDIALQDTSLYNERFELIVDLREAIQTDPDRADEYTELMNTMVSEMESELSKKHGEEYDIGPMLDMWEVEGGKSFGAFSEQMYEGELEASFESISDTATNIDLSAEQRKAAVDGLSEKKAAFESSQARLDEWNNHYDQIEKEMGTLWDRYEAIKDTDPDKNWLGESRFVWWGMATPDNPIQEEIYSLGARYKELNAAWHQGQLTERHAGEWAPLVDIKNRAESAYTSALEALENLKGE